MRERQPDPLGRPIERLVQEILRRSETDGDFRRKLLADPYAAIRETLGVELWEGVRIRFVERAPDVDALIVLPDFRGDTGTSATSTRAAAWGSGGGRRAWGRRREGRGGRLRTIGFPKDCPGGC